MRPRLALQAALAWLEHRRRRWPDTANPHLLINKQTALETGPISGVSEGIRNPLAVYDFSLFRHGMRGWAAGFRRRFVEVGTECVMPPSPLGLLEERREAARVRVEDLEAELERLEGELRSARAVLERRVVAVEELTEALAPAGDGVGPAQAGVRVPPKGAVVPVWREGLDPV
ncbi:hypothetical protein ACH4E7_45625, partial [Kitasatospora sp. NPDC018058]